MNRFETELKNGNFVVGECPNCNLVIWPPSDFCNKCFEPVKWRNSQTNGKLIEFSIKEGMHFCLAEFEGTVRIMGMLKPGKKEPIVGQKVKLDSCSMNEGNYNFEMSLV